MLNTFKDVLRRMVCQYLVLTTENEPEVNISKAVCKAGVNSKLCPKGRISGIVSPFCWRFKITSM